MKYFNEIFIDKTKYGVKIQTGEYGKQGKHIIVDQGQNQIAGYTDREDGLFEEVPVIIFGDHTRVIKYIDQPFFLGADGVKVLRSKDGNTDYKYLYYALKNVKIPNTGYNRHFKWLKESKIEYPDIKEQRKIVRILDKVSDIIRNRKRELSQLDDLVRARFVEMFGDPFANEKKWQMSDIKAVCERVTDGEHGSVSRVNEGHPFLNAKHIKTDGSIDWNTVTYVSNEDHAKIYKRCNPEQGDILMTTTGTIGNIAVVPDVIPFSMDRGITLLKLNKNVINPVYLSWLLRFDSLQAVMKANVHASAIGHLFLNQVERLPVMLPGLQLQNQFADLAREVDKSKLRYQLHTHTCQPNTS